MYSARWSPRLRQGDILGPLPLPLVGTDFTVSFKTRSLVLPEAGNEELSVTMKAEKVLVTVISHDCEFNEGKRNKLLVARLQKPQGNLTEEKRQDLRDSNDVHSRASAGVEVAGVDGFVFAPLHGVFADEQVASFTTITPLPMKMKDELYKAKRAELEHEHRVLFRTKLAWFMGRAADDIPDADKIDPPPRDNEQGAEA